MEPRRKFWNQQQQALRRALTRPAEPAQAMDLFLSQHAMVHTAQLTRSGLWSFEDEVWQDTTETIVRCLPRNGEHSLAWIFWHLTRIEDATMNVLLAGRKQVLQQADWPARLKVTLRDTGNATSREQIMRLSATIDLTALRAYRLAVVRQTRRIVKGLKPEAFKQRVAPDRLQRLLADGTVVEAAHGLIDYWGGLTLAGLLLMPPTRHNFVHLNEALRVKQKAMREIA